MSTDHRKKFDNHIIKEHYTTRADEVRALFYYRPGSTNNSLAVVFHQSAVLFHSATFGSLVLQPFAPDPIKWLWEATLDYNLFVDAIPKNLKCAAEAENTKDIWEALGCMMVKWEVKEWR